MNFKCFVAAAALLTASLAAKADTYTLYGFADSSGNIDNIGFTNNGNSFVVVQNAGYNGPCGLYADQCFTTFTPPGGFTYSTTEPTLDDGSGPGTFVLSGITGGLTEPPLSVTNTATGMSTVVYRGGFGSAMINSYGDVAFIGYLAGYASGDENFLAVDDTTHAAITPEPSSFALLGTGLLGVAGVLKRRFA